MDRVNNTREEQFSFLFDDARKKLIKMGEQSEQQKKQIVIELAKNLEGKIPMCTICLKIVKQLRGLVSERYIRACLDEKYKQTAYVYNARKQQKQTQEESKLAVLSPPNQEKKKQIIVLDNDGRTSLQNDGHEPSKTVKDSLTQIDKDFIQASHLSESQHKQELKKALEKSSQLSTADKIVIAEGKSPTHKYDNEDSILSFEFPINYKDLQNYLNLPYSNAEDNIKVWFNGRVNMETGEVISSNLGRLSSPQTARG